MIEFHSISLDDKDECDRIFKLENSMSADYNFGNIYMWDKRYKQHICIFGDRILIQLRYQHHHFYAFPVGSGPIEPAIEALKDSAITSGHRLRISGITSENKILLEKFYPGKFDFFEDEPYYDYIYLTEKLSNYSGKKLHSKKNFCNRFESTYNWSFENLTMETIPECLKMLDYWLFANNERLEDNIDTEKEAIIRGFSNFNFLDLVGGILRIDGKIVAFAAGEISSSTTFDMHFEKALNIPGAYAMICREMARMIIDRYPEIIYINREDDMGIESLKKSKLSYKPEIILKKYTAKYNE